MIFSTQNQIPNCFIFLFFGIVFYLFYSAIKIAFLIKNNKILAKNIINLIFFAIFSIFFVILLNIFNLGYFSFALLLCFCLGGFSCQKLTNNLVVFLQNKWYNVINKIKRKEKCNQKELKE